jgi:hypothetical protein
MTGAFLAITLSDAPPVCAGVRCIIPATLAIEQYIWALSA